MSVRCPMSATSSEASCHMSQSSLDLAGVELLKISSIDGMSLSSFDLAGVELLKIASIDGIS